ncbi:MAG: hypothetical protein HY064_13010 [Bacteroidetes bacterium]|nr:hypothetical protein [Bacteroidota bacterium]
MKKYFLLIAFLLGLLAMIPACKHDPILPSQQVSFENDIRPIIRGSCQHNGCHDTLSTTAKPIDSYNDMMTGERIVAGKPHKSDLYNRVSGASDDKMPKDSYPALTDTQIRFLYVWIAQGAQNN